MTCPRQAFPPQRQTSASSRRTWLDDAVLALGFIACHPVLSHDARVALTLRVTGGLTSDEIARAFLVPTATVHARITRAKKNLSVAQVHFEVPPVEERRERLSPVLSVLYVIFTEARRQDRRRWDRAAIRRGRAALVQAGRVGRGLGVYGVQAAIAECHAIALSVADTNWERIVVLYNTLGRLAPSPVIELNRSVALSMTQGPAAALLIADELIAGGQLAGSHLLPSVRGELLTQRGQLDDAKSEFVTAIDMCRNTRERVALERKLISIS